MIGPRPGREKLDRRSGDRVLGDDNLELETRCVMDDVLHGVSPDAPVSVVSRLGVESLVTIYGICYSPRSSLKRRWTNANLPRSSRGGIPLILLSGLAQLILHPFSIGNAVLSGQTVGELDHAFGWITVQPAVALDRSPHAVVCSEGNF